MKYKYILIITINCLLLTFCFAQDEEKYTSSERKAYYDSLRNTYNYKFLPISKEKVLKVPYNYITLKELDTLTIKKVGSNYTEEMSKKLELFDVPENEVFKKYENPMLSIVSEKYNGKIAKLYLDSKYDDFVWKESGIWLALSYDNGKSFKSYYTGLSDKYYYSFKKYESLPVWKNDSTLQVRASIVRMIDKGAHPFPPPRYETIGNTLIELNINKIIKDSDNDGLTDIEEYKMLLDPFSEDTDSDGIHDLIDSNPRFISNQNIYTLLYEALIDDLISYEDTLYISKESIIENKNKIKSKNYKNTYLIVTDDKNLQCIDPVRSRFIIMSRKEFEEYDKKYPCTFMDYSVSKLFKVDNTKDGYLISISFMTGGEEYFVKKHKNGWNIKLILSWIS